MSDDEFEDFEPMDVSQSNDVVEASVVPLDPSEDAQFSEQQFINIQERLTRINKRINMANSALAQLKRSIKNRVALGPVSSADGDKLAGGDNPLRGDETDAGDETHSE